MSSVSAVPTELQTPVQSTRQRRRTRRWLVWTAGIVVLFGMTVAVLLPSLCRPRETANRVKCASNLRQIGQAITLYAKAHDGQYPPTLSALIEEEDLTPDVLICPSSSDELTSAKDSAAIIADISAAESDAPGHKNCLSYVYVGRKLNSKTVTDQTVVAL